MAIILHYYKAKVQISFTDFRRAKMKYLTMLAVLGMTLIAAPYAHAQRVVVGLGFGPAYVAPPPVYVGAPPVCAYGYYDYYPYDCAPYGYYGPSWFSGGVFIGAGPWFRGYYGRPGYYGRSGFYGGPFVGRSFANRGNAYVGRGPSASFRGGTFQGRSFQGGGSRGGSFQGRSFQGGGSRGGSFHGGGSRGGGSHGGGHR